MDKKNIIELLQPLMESPYWEKPQIGFASGADPLFKSLKEDIGDFYLTPLEVFHTKYTGAEVNEEDLTVVSFAFSHVPETKKEQASQKSEPGVRWMISRNSWKIVVREFYENVGTALDGQGIRFTVPDLMAEMKVLKSEKYGLTSVWSQRHTAFAAGLGTFGLSEGLITRQGVAMRFASVVIDKKYEPDNREYKSHQEWCLFYKNGSCMACAVRCPAKAITKDGHDKDKCREYLDKMGEKHHGDPRFDNREEVGCGLCQSAVPCADMAP